MDIQDSLGKELATGLAEVDAAHQDMLEQLQQLAAMDDHTFPDAYESMVESVECDFSGEEAMMEEMGYPGLKPHREQHARVLSGLHHALASMKEGSLADARRAIELLPQWFELHIATMDVALAVAWLEACPRPVARDTAS